MKNKRRSSEEIETLYDTQKLKKSEMEVIDGRRILKINTKGGNEKKRKKLKWWKKKRNM